MREYESDLHSKNALVSETERGSEIEIKFDAAFESNNTIHSFSLRPRKSLTPT